MSLSPPLLCELHAHSTWSDGALTIPELVDLYGSSGFDVLCVTDHANRSDDPWLTPRERRLLGVNERSLAAYLAQIDCEAERAREQYGLLLMPGVELSYNDVDPLLAAHAVAVGLRSCVSLDGGIDEAIRIAREEGAAIIAAHPYRPGTGPVHPRTTQYLAANWERLAPLVDRWELWNREAPFPWVADAGLPAVASGDFHRPEHLWGWKTLLPCSREERAVVGALRSQARFHLARVRPAGPQVPAEDGLAARTGAGAGAAPAPARETAAA